MSSVAAPVFPTTTSIQPLTVSKPASLSREVLKWLQSLDLAYSVKQVKRDFSNGFLVAEIFSRYYGKEFSMHSYDNGYAMKVRKDNWKQLLKVFRKIGLPTIITENEVSDIVYCRDGAAVIFINRIYEVLTQRKVQNVIKRPLPDSIPPFARPTASTVANSTSKSPEICETNDVGSCARTVQEKIGDHEKSILEAKSLEADRFSHPSKTYASSSAFKKDATKAKQPQVVVKNIQVRQLGQTSISAIKESITNPTKYSMQVTPYGDASNNNSHDSNADMSTGEGSKGNNTSNNSLQQSDDFIEQPGTENVAYELFNEAFQRHNVAFGSLEEFSSAIQNNSINEEIVSSIFSAVSQKQVTTLVDIFLQSKSAFINFVDVLCPLLYTLEDASSVPSSAMCLLAHLGELMVEKNSAICTSYMKSYILPSLLAPLSTSQTSLTKRYYLLAMIYIFVPDEPYAHYTTIKMLQESVGPANITFFKNLLPSLIQLESRFNDENLVDIYSYYAIIGLSSPDTNIKANALFITSCLASSQTEWAINLLPTLEIIANQQQSTTISSQDEIDFVSCQLLVAVAAIMDSILQSPSILQSTECQSYMTSIEKIIQAVFKPDNDFSLSAKLVGLSEFGRFVAAESFFPAEFGSYLVSSYVKVLLSLPAASRLSLLELQQPRAELSSLLPASSKEGPIEREISSMVGHTEGVYFFRSIVMDWDGLKVAQELQELISSAGSADFPSLQVIAASILHRCRPELAIEDNSSRLLSEEWETRFQSLENYVHTGLSHPSTVELCLDILRCFMAHSSIQEALLNDTLSKSLQSMYATESNVPTEVLQIVEKWLQEVWEKEGAFASKLKLVLAPFSELKPTLPSSSTLPVLLSSMGL